MTEITAEGNASTTTTVIDSKNGSVPKASGKVLKRTVTEDLVTTFSSPAAWLLVIALIITWSAVAVVMFDLVDYKNLSASSISKIGSDPLKLVHDAVEETTDWVYGFFSLLSDIISSEGDEEDDDDGEEDTDKGEIEEPPLKKKKKYTKKRLKNWRNLKRKYKLKLHIKKKTR
ncbi:TPA: triadin [Bos taurus]|uniref:Triadin n=1 Tax=Bos taurus TaxID=9913 RepID=A6QNN1_BOVIN|nr:TRDN protein [Bos taurus]DAA26341.1 TPA: triadin [Bos taurus]